ncbi:L-seryl-tRNA(Sec) selenium transferase [Geopsychrobacter electrodiphilus]|uniref:L-seryl-tRNA(Sec) selenium transferase n=1 Tax=Geopsychrobacter electrodiphilus TaxID=225196 RepID=UPI00037FB677|nr:L-seryl-tRNA(Sec) selenium transferase [Geopsychrobacter electrodiphilus]
MSSHPQNLLRKLPGVDRVLVTVQGLVHEDWPAHLLTAEIQQQIADLRAQLLSGALAKVPALEVIARAVIVGLNKFRQPSLRRVINASGILLHTNLGRAPLAVAALEQIQQVASGYSNLEMDLVSGRRGSRHTHVEDLLCRLSGAEAAMVVNNNAGAVLLALTALAKGKEALVSRGELVEIGGSFRIPDVMEAGGVKLHEVGSSNRTHLRDYEQTLGPDTALLLKVHTSNYKVVGFTSSVTAAELVALAAATGIPLLEDLGSGLLKPLPNSNLPYEPTIAEAVATGVDLLTCSGDKLLGGPQAGLIFGRREWVDKLRKHPLARALRIDKLSLAALEATLRLYLTGEESKIPLMAYFGVGVQELEERSRRLMLKLEPLSLSVELIEDAARVGGGAMPEAELAGPALALTSDVLSLDQLAAGLRASTPALVCRLHEGRLLLNLRTVDPLEESLIVDIFKTLLLPDSPVKRGA